MKRYLLLIIFICLFLLTGCGKEEKLSVDDIESILTYNNFSIQDVTYQLSDYEYITNVLYAQKEDYSFSLEIYITDTNKNAKAFYLINKEVIQENENETIIGTESSNDTTMSYSLEKDDIYQSIIIKDNMLIYLNIDITYQGEALEIISKLGFNL